MKQVQLFLNFFNMKKLKQRGHKPIMRKLEFNFKNMIDSKKKKKLLLLLND